MFIYTYICISVYLYNIQICIHIYIYRCIQTKILGGLQICLSFCGLLVKQWTEMSILEMDREKELNHQF